jgi:predicted GNAT superfamily acetyltransferase
LEAQEAEVSIPTDRFIAEKYLDESEFSYSYDSIQTVISVDEDGFPESTHESAHLRRGDSEWGFEYLGSSRVVGIEIPRKFESLSDDVGLAWRYATRKVFENLLTNNGGKYTLMDFISYDSNEVKENTYVLLRDVR